MELEPTINLVDAIVAEYPIGDVDEATRQLKVAYESITRKFFECLDLSNFYAVEDKFIRAIGIGTGCLLVNEISFGKAFQNPVPFEFICGPISNLSIDARNNGRIYGVFQEMKIRKDEVQELSYDAVHIPSDGEDDNPEHI
jgi:hypothetical protein